VRTDAGDRQHHPPSVLPGTATRLALGVFLPPFAWAMDLELGVFSLQRVCASGDRGVLHLLSLVAFAVVVLGGALAASAMRELGGFATVEEEGDDGVAARTRLFARTGILFALLFALLVVGTAIPRWVLPPC
jgi:hypothetical protein